MLCLPASALAAPPTGGFSFSPNIPLAGQNVSFVANVSDPDPGGSITSYQWDFGDGATATGASVTHPYTSGGLKHVTLTATDSGNESNTFSNTVTVDAAAPVASFKVDPASRLVQVDNPTFTFTSLSTDETGINSSVWTFGDGSPPTPGTTVTHPYPQAGSYIVTLKVTDTDGVSSSTSLSVRVNAPPVAAFVFAVRQDDLFEGQTYNVPVLGQRLAIASTGSGDSDGTIKSYEWDLDGDGVFTAGAASMFPTAFPVPGVVNVGLRVTDNDGKSTTITKPVSSTSSRRRASRQPDVAGRRTARHTDVDLHGSRRKPGPSRAWIGTSTATTSSLMPAVHR